MGALVALFDKKGEAATEPAFTMLKALSLENADAYGIASPSVIKTGETLEKLRAQKFSSKIVIGHILSRVLARDKAQPLRIRNAAFVFEGRIFPVQDQKCDAEVFASKMSEERTGSAEEFVRETEGDFVFALAEPERLVVGRDVLGVRPLYYGENKRLAGLASERKPLWKIGIEEVNSFPPGAVAEIGELGFRFTVAKRIATPDPEHLTMEDASTRLQILLEKSVSKRTEGLKEVAVAFSGGIDSSIIAFLAKKAGTNVQLIHVSLTNQSETEHAKTVADELKLPIHISQYTEKDVLQTLPSVMRLIEENDPVKTSIGIPFFWLAEKAARLKLGVILTGQGGDELFGGYRRYVDDYINEGRDRVQLTMTRDVIGIYESNLEMDVKICNFHGRELRLPFATYQMARFALSLPVELKLQPNQGTLRKFVLRRAGFNLGLPQSTVDRPKRAMQYATGVNKVLDRLAKQRKLSVKEYLNDVYQTVLKRMTMND